MDVKTSIQTLNECKDKAETLETLLKEMKSTDIIPTKPIENEKWFNCYEKWGTTLQKTYGETLQKENLEEAYSFNRKMGILIKNIRRFAIEQGSSYLYAMGMFTGIFFAMSGMLPSRNKEQIFNIRMAGLKSRTYVKEILENLYESDYIQHKDLCERVNASPSQLNRTMDSLIDIGCIRRYKRGKYSLYSLTPMGRKYTKEFLGYVRKDYLEYDAIMLAGKKPQIEIRKQQGKNCQIQVRRPTEGYSIGDSANEMYKNKYSLSIVER